MAPKINRLHRRRHAALKNVYCFCLRRQSSLPSQEWVTKVNSRCFDE
jgi:hypothetical protein